MENLGRKIQHMIYVKWGAHILGIFLPIFFAFRLPDVRFLCSQAIYLKVRKIYEAHSRKSKFGPDAASLTLFCRPDCRRNQDQ
jgi:hypothetical protein